MTTGADWLDTARRVLDTFLAPPASSSGPSAEGSGEGSAHADTCRWCPVCQAVAVARGERPEVSAALADLLTTSAAALRTFAESVPAPAHPAAADVAEAGDDADPAAPPARTVQRIDIG
jgi:hypothetical protein